MRRSTATWAVLGLVIERPSYGYELGQRFDRRLGEIVQLSLPGIYKALDTLVAGQDIERLDAVSNGDERQPKPRYRATTQGARAYREWMVSALRDGTQAPEVLARLATTAARDPSLMLRVLDEYERLCLRQASAQRLLDVPPSAVESPHALMDDLVAQHTRMAAAETLEWIRYARQRVQAHTAARQGFAES